MPTLATSDRKRCTLCKTDKPLSDFYGKVRVESWCKPCKRAYVAARPRYKDQVREAVRRYRQTPEGVAASRAARAKCYYKFKDDPDWKRRFRARIRLHEAVKRGKVVRGPCAKCGALDVHGHHHDYTKPLEVTWLCPTHHRHEHGAR